MALVVKLSGGTEKARKWQFQGESVSQKQLIEGLLELNSNLEFIKSGRAKADYIVYPDDIDGPSDSALLAKKPTGTKVLTISKFVAHLKRKNNKKPAASKKASKKKSVAASKKKAVVSSKKKSVAASKKKNAPGRKKKDDDDC